MKPTASLFVSLALLFAAGCGGEDDSIEEGSGEASSQTPPEAEEEDHTHDENPLETITLGDHQVKLAQAHGKVTAGMEAHLVVKLPYSDGGATIVRAWIGTEDRTRSLVGLGEYASSHDDYDVHAMAPDPLPDGVRWWIELQPPDGTKLLGSAQPLL